MGLYGLSTDSFITVEYGNVELGLSGRNYVVLLYSHIINCSQICRYICKIAPQYKLSTEREVACEMNLSPSNQRGFVSSSTLSAGDPGQQFLSSQGIYHSQ